MDRTSCSAGKQINGETSTRAQDPEGLWHRQEALHGRVRRRRRLTVTDLQQRLVLHPQAVEETLPELQQLLSGESTWKENQENIHPGATREPLQQGGPFLVLAGRTHQIQKQGTFLQVELSVLSDLGSGCAACYLLDFTVIPVHALQLTHDLRRLGA